MQWQTKVDEEQYNQQLSGNVGNGQQILFPKNANTSIVAARLGFFFNLDISLLHEDSSLSTMAKKEANISLIWDLKALFSFLLKNPKRNIIECGGL